MNTFERSPVTGSFGKAGLAEGTNAATIKTNAPNGAGIDFAIKGIGYHKADTDNIAMTALALQAADTNCMYGVMIDSSGTVSLTKGNEVLTTKLGLSDSLQAPPITDNTCPIGFMKIATVAVTFTSGTTDLSASGVTATFYDLLGGIWERPQVS